MDKVELAALHATLVLLTLLPTAFAVWAFSALTSEVTGLTFQRSTEFVLMIIGLESLMTSHKPSKRQLKDDK